MMLFVSCQAAEPKPVKLETNRTLILSPTGCALCEVEGLDSVADSEVRCGEIKKILAFLRVHSVFGKI